MRSESLATYQTHLETLMEQLDEVEYTYLPGEENQFADALAKLASMVCIPTDTIRMPLTIERRYEPAYVHALDDEQESQEEDEEPWYTDIFNYVTKGEYPPNTDKRARRDLRLLAS